MARTKIRSGFIVWLMLVFLSLNPSAFAQVFKNLNQVKNNADGTQTLLNHIPRLVARGLASKIAHLDSNRMLDLRILLAPKDPAGLAQFIKELYDPKSPNYHKFITPEQYNLMFGASSTDSTVVVNYLKANGFFIRGRSKNGYVITASAPVSAVEPTFKVNINRYKSYSGALFFSPDTNPILPVQLTNKVDRIAGMDNAVKFHPHYFKTHQLQKLNTGSLAKTNILHAGVIFKAGSSSLFTARTNPCAPDQCFLGVDYSLGPQDIDLAYNLNSVTSTGSGQTIGLYELDGYIAGDITQFETYYGLPNVTLTNIYTDSFNGEPGAGALEDTGDIDVAIATAPGLSGIRVYEAPDTDQGWIDQWDAIINDSSRPSIISVSWGNDEPENYSTYDHSVFSELATLGVSVLASAGDSGAWDNCVPGELPGMDGAPTGKCIIGYDVDNNAIYGTANITVDDPGSDPYVTSAGISVLTTINPGEDNESYGSETASIDGGGGISSYVSLPTYQTAVANSYYTATSHAYGSTTWRNVPDVSFTADSSTSYGVYESFEAPSGWYGFAGSSAATPIWAAFIARVNQGRVALGETAIGWLNPQLYQVAGSSRYSTDFHDITSNITVNISGTDYSNYFPTETGYDLATGLGSFNGANLYSDLIGLVAPTGLSAGLGTNQINLTWNTVSGASYYNVERSATSGGPYTVISTSGIVTTGAFSDTNVSIGTTYYYVVSAVNAAGIQGANSSEVNETFIGTPTNLSATPNTNNQVALSWTAVTSATGYNIKRATSTGNETTVATSATNSYNDSTGLTPGTTYYYEVSATDGNSQSPNSNESSATVFGPPSGFTATSTTGQVSLSWTSEGAGYTYNIYKSTTSGQEALLNVSGPLSGASYNDSAVTNGTPYFYKITAVNVSSQESSKSSEITVTPLAIPTGFTVTPGNAQTTLNWTAVTGATGYHIKRSTTSGSEATVTTVTAPTITYNDTGLTNGTPYYYEISAIDTGGESTNTTETSATPFGPPSGSAATSTTGQVSLSWTTDGAGYTYNIYKSTTSGQEALLNTSGPLSGTSYNDTAVTNGSAYYYEITAVNVSSQESSKSSEITATPLAIPSGFTVTPGNAQTTLNWTAVTGATGYHIKRSTTSGGEATVATVTAPTVTYNDTGLANGTTYYYEISAIDTGGESTNTGESSATPFGPPSGFAATSTTSQVSLSWTTEGAGYTYNIYKSTTSGQEALLNTSGPLSGTSYNDTAVTNGSAYYYKITAVNVSSQESSKSSEITATPLAIPSGFTVTPGNAQTTLNWTLVTGATGYHVKRSTTSGGEATVATVTAPTVTYNDTGLNNGTTYYYEISAIDTGGESTNTTETSATPFGPPSGFTAASTTSEIALNWTSEGAGYTYNIYKSTTSGQEALLNTSGPLSGASYTDSAVSNGIAYYYEITAVNQSSVESGKSSEVNATPLAIPTGLIATPGNTQISLNWTAVTGATSYHIWKSTTSGAEVEVASSGTNSYTDSGLTNGQTYYYETEAIDVNGASIVSSQTSTISGLPTPPTSVSAVSGNTQATVYFSGANGNGSSITYTVTASPGNITATGSSSPIVITGLTNFQAYTFTVTAQNGVGTSSASITSNSVTPSPVAAPTSLSFTKLGVKVGPVVIYGGVALTWTQSASPNIQQNKIYRSTDGTNYSLIATSNAAVQYRDTSSLVKRTTYYYEVTAVDSNSSESTPSNIITVSY